MASLLIIFAATMVLSYWAQYRVLSIRGNRSAASSFCLAAIIVMMSLHCGLRTAYNDTLAYIRSFQSVPTLEAYLAGGVDLTKNPLFGMLQCVFRNYISDNCNLFFFCVAMFTMTCFVTFIKRFSHDFTFSMILFYTLLYLLPFGAMKQGLAMAIMTIAITNLLNGRKIAYFLLVGLAALFHTYAIVFVVLPVFLAKPWTLIVYAAVAAVAFIIVTFEESITRFIELSDGFGRDLVAEELLTQPGMNFFRIAVYGVPPLMSFLFQSRCRSAADKPISLMINMSVISFLFCCMGAVNAANMFGRSAIYFMMGAIISLPWMIERVFEPKSAKFVKSIAVVCYLLFFWFDTKSFVAEYRAISVFEFVRSIFT